MGIAEAILALIQFAPAAISEVTAVYNAVRDDLSTTDQATIDAALAHAMDADAIATAKADAALDAASKR